ncbi:hypothetical protein BH24CHL5_BH24CHL5_03210 [soil metagenome]
MNITRLRLADFKRHAQLDIELAPGLNVIRGPNEAGKSTIQRAIEMGLFRRPTFASAELEEVRTWADADAEPTVELEFVDDGRTGRLRKVFAGQKGTVELTIGDESFNDPAAVDQQVARLTGLASEKFFRATASVHHQELGGLAQDESTLRDRLQQSMSGADRGTHAARRKLEETIRRYRTEGAKNPGYLKVLRAEVARLRDSLMAGEAALGRLETDRRSLAQARAARAALDAAPAEGRAELTRAERAAELAARAAEAGRRYTTYKRAAEVQQDIARLEAAAPTTMPLPTLRASVERLRDLEFKLSEMRAELAAEPDLSSYDAAIPRPNWRPWLRLGPVLMIGGLGLGALGMMVNLQVVGLVLGGLLVALGVWSIVLGQRQRRRMSDFRLQNELRESEIARRLAGRTDLADRVRGLEGERTVILARSGIADLPRAEAILDALAEHNGQLAAKRAEYRGMLGDDADSQDAAALRDKAAAEGDEWRHALAGMGELGREPEKHVAAQRVAIQRMATERDAAIHAEAQADARVTNNAVDAERVAADAEALKTVEEQLAATERRLRIYDDVLATIDSAEQGTMKNAARFLEQRMARDIERITDGRYRRLRVDEATLTFSVYSPDSDGWIDVRRLSQGTLDQLYLCARLGIVRQVTEPANPPLIFDDPFITFDDERAERALALLKDMAREFQVIYLTHSERYDALADTVVVLDGPTERDDDDAALPPATTGEPLSMWSSAALPEAAPRTTRSSNGHGRPQPVSASGPSAPDVEHEPLWPEGS